MPKRKDIQKIMVIGSGPIVIGQAAEFDYAGTQAWLGTKTILNTRYYSLWLIFPNHSSIIFESTLQSYNPEE